MALNQYETDEQRAEVLIDWLKRNVAYLILLVVIVIGSIAGVEYYKRSSVDTLSKNFDTYESFLTQLDSAAIDAAMGEKLIANNEDIYQVFSAMLLAKEAHDAGEYDNAANLLKGAIANADGEAGLQALLHYRLAIVLFDQDNNEAALSSLKEIQVPEFLGLRKVLEGDIYQSMGRLDDAKISYEEALNSVVVPDNVQSKLNLLSAQ